MHITELKSTKNDWDSICHRGGIRVYCENCETGDRTNDGITQIQYAAIGARIRSRRLEMGLTQAQLGRLAGVSGSFVGHLERAEKIPSVETLMRLCIGMDMSMDYLVMGVRRECERTRCALYEELRELLDRYTRNKSELTNMTK